MEQDYLKGPLGYGPKALDKGDLTYQTYLKVPELLSLQKLESDPPHHDEMLFIIIHQAYELWFKLILLELDKTKSLLEKTEILEAQHFVNRVAKILNLGVQQIHILETMRPADFLHFRERLMPASGFQSLQFREVEFLLGIKDERYLRFFEKMPDQKKQLEDRLKEKDLRTCFYELLARQRLELSHMRIPTRDSDDIENQPFLDSLTEIYRHPNENMQLYLLMESLMDVDQAMCLWREHHVRVVERVIGFKQGTGGSAGVEYLKSTASKKAFPLLWEVRTLLKL